RRHTRFSRDWSSDVCSSDLYGSRGTNGVVVVTTKSAARAGEGVFSVNLSSGTSRFNQGNVELMNSAELWDLYQSFQNQDAIPPKIGRASCRERVTNWMAD